MQDVCFGTHPSSFAHVLQADAQLIQWATDLPPHFRIQDPDRSLDTEQPYLVPQRLSLHSKYHLCRIVRVLPLTGLRKKASAESDGACLT